MCNQINEGDILGYEGGSFWNSFVSDWSDSSSVIFDWSKVKMMRLRVQLYKQKNSFDIKQLYFYFCSSFESKCKLSDMYENIKRFH